MVNRNNSANPTSTIFCARCNTINAQADRYCWNCSLPLYKAKFEAEQRQRQFLAKTVQAAEWGGVDR